MTTVQSRPVNHRSSYSKAPDRRVIRINHRFHQEFKPEQRYDV
jgi:hypothetical protein